jgi:hypothetical protein
MSIRNLLMLFTVDERTRDPKVLRVTRKEILVLGQTGGCLFGASPRLLGKWCHPGAVDLDSDGPLEKGDRQYQAMLPPEIQ